MKRIISALLALVLALGVFGAMPRAEAAIFSDVKPGDWYYNDVKSLVELDIINGMGDGSFRPDDYVRRGEFIKMLAAASEHLPITPPTGKHWSELYWNALYETGVLEVVEADAQGNQYATSLIPLDAAELEKYISRYEMAYLINRVLYLIYYENQMELKNSGDSYANHIADYNSIDLAFQGSVEQVFAKGILQGYEDGSFKGGNQLTRAEAATAIVRVLWTNKRVAQTFAVEKKPATTEPEFTPFAIQYRTMSDAQRRQALFGDAGKTHFTSSGDAGDRVVPIQVKTWDINSSGGKYTRTWTLYVHRLVAREAAAIFEEIYNDPERFPIKSLGGARYSDTMRHSWGCAIDINPNENYYINYRTGQTVGSFCWKNGSSPYCITPESSVVRAFAKYGWGWGGQGWSTAADYMHFSILASGG